MNICMVGIDYSKAKVEEREIFSLTAANALKTAAIIKEKYKAAGCIIISTCNRTELWCSGLNDLSPYDVFIKERGHETINSRHLFTEREGEEAVVYLMELASGLHSQIFGEDQILTQVKQALAAGHENQLTDAVLETLFRNAITAAKKIKSEVKLSKKDQSVPARAVSMLRGKFGDLAGKSCVIIGNGEMGKLAAASLREEKCKMSMTVRQYKRKKAVIPWDCTAISYDDRYLNMKDADIIISATLSPHYTVLKDKLQGVLARHREYVFVDLAVPRDIDPAVAELENVTLLDMDNLGVENAGDAEQVNKAYEIIHKYYKEFLDWLFIRNYSPVVGQIGLNTGIIANGKLKNLYKELSFEGDIQEKVEVNVQRAAEKAVEKVIYRLRDYLDRETWKDCIIAMEQAAKESR